MATEIPPYGPPTEKDVEMPMPGYPPALEKNKGGDVRKLGNMKVAQDAKGLDVVKDSWMKTKGLTLPVLAKLGMALPIESLMTLLPNLVELVEYVLPGIIADRHDLNKMKMEDGFLCKLRSFFAEVDRSSFYCCLPVS